MEKKKNHLNLNENKCCLFWWNKWKIPHWPISRCCLGFLFLSWGEKWMGLFPAREYNDSSNLLGDEMGELTGPSWDKRLNLEPCSFFWVRGYGRKWMASCLVESKLSTMLTLALRGSRWSSQRSTPLCAGCGCSCPVCCHHFPTCCAKPALAVSGSIMRCWWHWLFCLK